MAGPADAHDPHSDTTHSGPAPCPPFDDRVSLDDLADDALFDLNALIWPAGPVAPPPVLPVEGFNEHVPVFTDVECPSCDGGRCDCLDKLVKICAADDEDWPCLHVRAYEYGGERVAAIAETGGSDAA